jgi:hypothetical protein
VKEFDTETTGSNPVKQFHRTDVSKGTLTLGSGSALETLAMLHII